MIGLVGSEDKVDWCKNELGFDHVINYKKKNFSDGIAEVAPEGVDIYFDNVIFINFHYFYNNLKKILNLMENIRSVVNIIIQSSINI